MLFPSICQHLFSVAIRQPTSLIYVYHFAIHPGLQYYICVWITWYHLHIYTILYVHLCRDQFIPGLYLVWPHQGTCRTLVWCSRRAWRIISDPLKSSSCYFWSLLASPWIHWLYKKKQSSVSIFHLSMTLSKKKYFLRSIVQWYFISLTLCPLVDKLLLLSNNESEFGQDFPLSILNISIKSALLHLSSRVQRPSCHERSLYGRTFISGIILVKRCCTFSSNCLSLE